ncbi:dolichyl-diphosphooligosaccharide--protein glycosyltransferase subunit 2-like [Dendronephthya gigantea]|uniref:dolichyl-diphosphooligosaccharide--protein glycosyltransferase subunit 2-like n=1 Tax=Dendronephthya gigantea TaxID=151771 RepID=UPI00106D27FA|nr:dolichyl-diphosphooligosaccharide--protein glycosyltransferase subunit 2-like [Dendronephthya gigantea]
MATRVTASVLVLLCVLTVGLCAAPTTVLTLEEQGRIKAQLSADLPGKDLETTFYNVASLTLLNSKVPKSEEICKFVNKNIDPKDIALIFFGSSIGKLLGNCQVKVDGAQATLTAALNDKSDTELIRFAVESLVNLGLKVDEKATSDALKSILKEEKEEFVPSVTNTLFAASHLAGDVSFAFDAIEDAVAQADEIADTFLQFEGGLMVTADFITGVYKLAAHVKKAPTITEDQAQKFTNYLLSRKYVQSSYETFYLLSSLRTYADNQFQIPVIARMYSTAAISDENKLLKVRVTNTLDNPFTKMSVTADSILDKNDEELISKKPFSEQKDYYQIDVVNFKLPAGFYKIVLSLKPGQPDKRLLGLTDIELPFKVVTTVAVEAISISILDKEHASLVSSVSVSYPRGLDKTLEADHHQKVTMTFSLKDISAQKVMTAHQTFVRLTNAKTNQEIFFVAEPEGGKVYKFDLDVSAASKDSFGSLSGEYQIDLIIGDAAIENSLLWTIGKIQLTFASSPETPQQKGSQFKPKPEIQHSFRQPEKRPPKTVSTAFTILVLLPLLVLFVAWMKLGVNLSNFQFSIPAIVFHLGLGAIFLLMYAFWTSLNMFSTLKLLALIGSITFLAGNSLLANLAAQRTQK